MQLKPITEAEFQRQVIEYAKLFRWRVAHFRSVRVARKNGQIVYQTPVQADGAGFPDLMCVRERTVYIELKAQRGSRSPEQIAWGDALLKASQEYYVFRPSDWPEIEKVLR